jgi:FkbM family methyltransferase
MVVPWAMQRLNFRSYEIPVQLFFETQMTVRIPERVSVHLWRYGMFEPGLTFTFLTQLKKGMVVFDVGAHYGYFSLLASELVGSAGEVHAFEPSHQTFELLTRNVSNRAAPIVTRNVAIWSRHTTLLLRDFGPEYSAFNTVARVRLEGAEQQRALMMEKKSRINTETLDSYVSKHSIVPDFVKIDAENAELEVLRGMTQVMANHRPVVSIEVGDLGKDSTSSSRAILDFAVAQSYTPLEHRNESLTKHTLRDRYDDATLLLWPSERLSDVVDI